MAGNHQPAWYRRLGFAQRLLLVILLLTLTVTVTALGMTFLGLRSLAEFSLQVNTELGVTAAHRSRDALISRAETDLGLLVESQASLYNATLAHIRHDVANMAMFLNSLYTDPHYFSGEIPAQTGPGPIAQIQLPSGVAHTPETEADLRVVINAYWPFRDVLAANSAVSAVYVGTERGWMMRFMEPTDLDPNYDPRLRPWYLDAMAYAHTGDVFWTDIYVDAFTGKLINSVVMAFNGADGNPAGVVGVDLLLEYIINDLEALDIGHSGFAFLLDHGGAVLADTRTGGANSVPDEFNNLDFGIQQVNLDGTEFYVALAALPASGWSLGLAVSYDEIVADAIAMEVDIEAQSAAAQAEIAQQIQRMAIVAILLLIVVVCLVVVSAIWVARTLTRPLLALADGAAAIGAGDLDARIPVTSTDELGVVAQSFNRMAGDLKNHIGQLAEAITEKARISSDLTVATEIQRDMLPQVQPLFAGRIDVDIAALMQPAKEVGGDFYDMFFIDSVHTKLALVIADVSGKSVPAALFMVIAKTLIKNSPEQTPAEVLASVNNMLYDDNTSSMFVTTFYSILDLNTGMFSYASAGHNPPIHYRALDNSAHQLGVAIAPPLGVVRDRQFQAQSLLLAPGDAVLLYTDGVTEAVNAAEDMFGVERLQRDLCSFAAEPAAAVVDEISAAVKDFAAGEPQSDDITLLYAKYLGG